MQKKLRIAFVGMGRRSRAFLKPLAEREDVEVVAGADGWEAGRLQAQALHPGMTVHESSTQMWAAQPQIDLCFICSRDYEHRAHACEALNHGAHVFTEKPMATRIADCEALREAAVQARRRLLVGFNLRFNPAVCEALRFIAAGRLGRLRSIAEWHDVDLNYFHNWMSRRAESGGLLLQKASHDFDLFNMFAEAEPTHVSAFGGRNYYGGDRPDELYCPDCEERDRCPEAKTAHLFPADAEHGVANREQMRCAFRREIDVNDHHVVNMMYANGISGSYVELHGSPLNHRRFLILGTEGRLEFELHEGGFSFRPRDARQPEESWNSPKLEGSHGGADTLLVDAVLEAILKGTRFVTEAEEGIRAVRISVAAEESIRSMTTLDLSRFRD